MKDSDQPRYQHDLDETVASRARLPRNRNLMYWYQQLYCEIFAPVPDIATKSILEIGSGSSPLKHFLPTVITSDVLLLDHVDFVFDCHKIAAFDAIPDHSVDIISLTNVLHHLQDPMEFLHAATMKLTKGGELLIVEPYFSLISYPLYKLFHHEPVDFGISRPLLTEVTGPLSSSNQAIPYMIFFKRPDWFQELSSNYCLEHTRIGFYTSLSYFLTGGISRIFPVPTWLYRPCFLVDRFLAQKLPKMFASFFTLRLVTKA